MFVCEREKERERGGDKEGAYRKSPAQILSSGHPIYLNLYSFKPLSFTLSLSHTYLLLSSLSLSLPARSDLGAGKHVHIVLPFHLAIEAIDEGQQQADVLLILPPSSSSGQSFGDKSPDGYLTCCSEIERQ